MKVAAIALVVSVFALAGCGRKPASEEAASAPVAPEAPTAAPAAAAVPAPPAAAGFDPATAPLGRAPSQPWPYFGLQDGYARGTAGTVPRSADMAFIKDAPFDRYHFFDGTKFIPVEGRLFTTEALGKGASFFGVQKTYEKLVKDLGGVTVYEGTGQPIADNKLQFPDPRFRAQYRVAEDQMGVYMVKTPTSEVWVEVYRPWGDNSENYWLTIVEKKGLEVNVQAIPADEMRRALDANGRVALYVNFDTDKSSIRPDSQPIIAEIVKLLNNNPELNVVVEGHTDNVGGGPRNETLSEQRANAVAGALMAQGIAMSRLTPKGLGATKPLADNSTEDGRAKNRRVELVKR